MNNGITVKQLKTECDKLIKAGLGDREILITSDDEGNAYHTLFYSFITDKNEIKEAHEARLFNDNNDPNKVVLLG